ncbi:putative ABC transport system ATP-binding protein [Deinobacterium chartae]|uniref:Putative ABC transport system ATP-binding protein n=1 Tax=Deinobacterium chartae TaxID=521158 RepID=A0A841HY29_9DEIO|nr:ABC transporter ATP-binding protein [Deinobacterium chartae]MBB6097129.1 putative ABC transport system ATP-binding protein [Deinobacterium chartae]
MPAVLAAHGLRKTYPLGDQSVVALGGVDLTVQAGEFVSVMGPSGSGKSTLLHLLGLLDAPDAGSVQLGGEDTSGMSDDRLTALRRDRIGFIFQSFELIPTLTAQENILLTADLGGRGAAARARLPELARQLGLEGRLSNRPTELSGGQRQRVAIARAIIGDPLVLLADEPTGNLDSRTGREVLEIFRRGVDRSGWTVVMVTHDPAAALSADRIVFLRDGLRAGEVRSSDPQARRHIEQFVGV